MIGFDPFTPARRGPTLPTFSRQVYRPSDDNGIFVFQIASFLPRWQFKDIFDAFSGGYVHIPFCARTD